MVDRTLARSSLFAGLVSALLSVCAAIGLTIVLLPAGTESRVTLGLLGLAWLLWIATFVANYRLVSCGPVDTRYRDAPLWVNSPSVGARLFMHFVTNWLALVMTTIVAWHVKGTHFSGPLVCLSLVGAVAAWIGFNLRHRRMNHLRNLALSSFFAGSIVLANLVLMANR